MDIWEWTYETRQTLEEEGHHQLADGMARIASLVVDGEHEKVDAWMPELKSLAAQHPNKWIEVFFRHWYLQSKVLNRCEVKNVLHEAIDLVDLAHQPEAKDCPQSICSVQDLANCYANLDGPSYAEERLALAKETLAKIDPHWSCFICIGEEYLDALYDKGDFQGVLNAKQSFNQQILEAGLQVRHCDFAWVSATALIELNRLDEALEAVNKARNDGAGDHFEEIKSCMVARIHALRGDFDQARRHLLPFNRIARTMSLAIDYAEAIYTLAKAEQIVNDWQLNRDLLKLAENFVEHGCERDAFTIYKICFDLAINRNNRDSAEYALSKLTQQLSKIEKPMGADQIVYNAKQSLTQLPPTPAFCLTSEEDCLAQLHESPDVRLEQIIQARAQFDSSEALLFAHFDVLQNLERPKDALEQYKLWLESRPDSENVILRYGFNGGSAEFLRQLLDKQLSNDNIANIHWALSYQHQQAGEFELALKCVEQVLAIKPEAKGALDKAIHLARKTNAHEKGLTWAKLLHQLDSENKNAPWDICVLATILNDWPSLHEMANHLGMNIQSSEGEINETWEIIRLEFTSDSGEPYTLWARRTGPVTCRIISAQNATSDCKVGHIYVFDPAPLNALDQENEQGEKTDKNGYTSYLYSPITGLKVEAEHRCVEIDGVYPSADEYEAFRSKLAEQAWFFDIRSGQHYQLKEGDNEHKGIYALLYVPVAIDDLSLHQWLTENTAFEQPLIWPELAKLAKDQSAFDTMQAVISRFNIDIGN